MDYACPGPLVTDQSAIDVLEQVHISPFLSKSVKF